MCAILWQMSNYKPSVVCKHSSLQMDFSYIGSSNEKPAGNKHNAGTKCEPWDSVVHSGKNDSAADTL